MVILKSVFKTKDKKEVEITVDGENFDGVFDRLKNIGKKVSDKKLVEIVKEDKQPDVVKEDKPKKADVEKK